MVVMGGFGHLWALSRPIDAQNHDNHDNHYNSAILSTFLPEGHDNHYNSPVLSIFEKEVAETAGKPLQLKVVMVSLQFRRPCFSKMLKTREL